jgi:hypothetical protein
LIEPRIRCRYQGLASFIPVVTIACASLFLREAAFFLFMEPEDRIELST